MANPEYSRDNPTYREKRYKDFDLSFTRHPITNDLTVKNNEQAVKQSLRNLILLNFYEKPFHHNIASGLPSLLFENFSPLLKYHVQQFIATVIQNHEPRIDASSINVIADDDNNALSVTIRYRLNNQPDRTNNTLSMTLQRVR